MPAANRDLMRAMNRCNVLRTIRLAGTISRRDIAAQTGLSQATVTAITAELIKDNLIFEKEALGTTTGRPPVLLALNPDGAFVAGVYVSSDRISVVVINLEARVLASHELPLEADVTDPVQVADRVAESVRACCISHGFLPDDISGLGLGIPGLVNAHTGVVHFHPGFNQGFNWSNVPFRELVEKRTGFETFIENSSNALAIYEHWFGEARGCDDFLVVTLEHGVGLGIFADGRLVRGHKGMAGELGHIRGSSKGTACRCGLNGCLEAVASTYSIMRDARKLVKQGIWEMGKKAEEITLEDVVDAAKAGEPSLEEIIRRAGKVIGYRISDLTRLLDPEKVVITGKGYLAKDMLFEPLVRAMKERRCEVFGSMPELIIQPWQAENYARGAGALVLQQLHQNCNIHLVE
ncbi:ROK family transcriptional regulator [Salidesulfovibrio onnuriiensis]|uniref:ROK family transcriptional regulator n=1 Tax=Salidesulfovibrio onnuriiensis TaxID=2583823 RepID=UPI0011C91D27|nr:ROK family transcriptional regulator [Salidesulfovibrio onnuriiensis]